MKKIISIFLIVFLIISTFKIKSHAEDLVDYIDVKLTRPLIQNNCVNLKSSGGFSVFYEYDLENPIFTTVENTIKAIPNNGYIDLFDSSSNHLYSLPSDGSLLLGSNSSDEKIITVEKDMYRDYIKLLVKNNELVVINHVSLEHYLYGVVPREMSYTFPMEALKAQAVASRTYTVYNINKHINEGFNLCDTTHCQVYDGYAYERPATNQAVDETRGIMIYYDGNVIQAVFHSSSSGYTEDSSNVWGSSVPYLKSVADYFSLDSPYSSWSITISLSDLNERIKNAGIAIGELKNIEILETTDTNKVKKIKLIGTLSEVEITAEAFRNIIGTTSLKSAWFTIKGSSTGNENIVYVLDGSSLKPISINVNNAFIIDGYERKTVTRGIVSRAIGNDSSRSFQASSTIKGDVLVIEGSGYGHGVGMSQYGAKKMAEYGYDFEEILKYYYTGVDVYWWKSKIFILNYQKN